MNLKELLKVGTVSKELQTVSIEWESLSDGETYSADIYIKRMSYGAQLRAIAESKAEKPDVRAVVISAACRFGEDGKDRLTYEQVQDLDYNLVAALYNAVEQNAEADSKKKGSTQKKNSGAKSS